MHTRITALLLFSLILPAIALETDAVKKPGLTLQLGTDAAQIVPGKSFTVGLFLRHDPEYHTYWQAPGIVGVATVLEWQLPKGFTAGPIQWPAPQRTKMADITAYGYKTDACLLTTITVPESIDTKSVELKVRAGWMCCATECNPGWHDFTLTLPVSSKASEPGENEKLWAERFESNRKRFPKTAPTEWKFSAKKLDASALKVGLDLPEKGETDWSSVYFFCDDLQINSDKPQKVSRTKSGFEIHAITTDFAPKNPEKISGTLFRPEGWPGLDTKWIMVSTPWPK